MTVTPEQLAEWKALAERRGALMEQNLNHRSYGDLSVINAALGSVVPALIEALEVAQRDTERLDWLDNTVTEGQPQHQLGRKALDAAMARARDEAMYGVSPPEEERTE